MKHNLLLYAGILYSIPSRLFHIDDSTTILSMHWISIEFSSKQSMAS